MQRETLGFFVSASRGGGDQGGRKGEGREVYSHIMHGRSAVIVRKPWVVRDLRVCIVSLFGGVSVCFLVFIPFDLG